MLPEKLQYSIRLKQNKKKFDPIFKKLPLFRFITKKKFGADLLVIKSQAEYNFIQPYAATIIGSYGHALIGYYTKNTTSRELNN